MGLRSTGSHPQKTNLTNFAYKVPARETRSNQNNDALSSSFRWLSSAGGADVDRCVVVVAVVVLEPNRIQLLNKMEAALGLMRRIHPKHSETALSALLGLLPHLSSDLLSQVDQPLQVLCDVDSGKEFILCEYNRDADSYRSPWSNKYHPPLEDGPYPSSELRKLEIEANEVFSIYRDQYYEGGISSVYMWEDENEGFVACFLIKKDGSKTGHGRRGYLQEGSWDAIHVIEVGPDEEGITHYCLTSTIMLSLTTNDQSSGTFSLSGSIRRQMNMDLSIADGHLCNMGKMIEEMESKLRNSLDQVYFGKTKEMVCTLRPPAEVLPMRLPDS